MMTGLAEHSNWEDDIYQIETTDPVVGGPPDPATKDGLANIPSLQLANRTLWLKAQIQALTAAFNNIDISAQITAAIEGVIDGAPGSLDTLKELADALNDNDDAVAALTAQIAQKLDASSTAYLRSLNPVVDGSATIQGGSPKLTLNDNDGATQNAYEWSVNPFSEDGTTRLWGQIALQRNNGDGTYTDMIRFQSNGRAVILNAAASSGEALAGTDDTRLMTPLRTHQAIEEIAMMREPLYSAEAANWYDTYLTFVHGLGRHPRLVKMWLECTAPTQGIVVGERIEVSYQGYAELFDGASGTVTDTVIKVGVSNVRTRNGTTGGAIQIGNGNAFFKLLVEAW
ncbi:hypothetical protein [Ascidiaceihabitans sp.]|uniref:hypothetical protein n=1 Tax=Ascidiaceihabitans sp. TaxID=1872644 RepID=UPI003297E8EF